MLEQVEEEAAFPETRGRGSVRQRVNLPETIAEVPEGAGTEVAGPGLEVGGGNSVLAEEYLYVRSWLYEGPRIRMGQPKMKYWKLYDLHVKNVHPI